VPLALLDTDTLSEVLKARNPHVRERAREYLAAYGRFAFSIITRYEILRGLKAMQASRQIAAFEARCLASDVLPLTDKTIVIAADIYAELYRAGLGITDADILIAATAIERGRVLVSNNVGHFSRIRGLSMDSWAAAS
jgi:tRNA(fMet)-specific endonuclease VapC